MLKIGDFSRIGQVSVKTLRYYDEIGLLKASQTDANSGYRFYTFDQLPRLNRILALKEMGLSLSQIDQLLDDDLSAEQLRGMLRLKRVEIQQRMVDEQEKLARVEARLRMIEKEDKMPEYDVVIKHVDPLLVASVRDVIPSYPEQGGLWEELESFLIRHHVTPSGPCLTVYYTEEPDVDTEVCEPINDSLPPDPRIKSHTLPAIASMATTVHHGPFVTIGEAYSAILKWIDSNEYKISGPPREVYLKTAEDGSQTDPQTVTEIQFPVEKA